MSMSKKSKPEAEVATSELDYNSVESSVAGGLLLWATPSRAAWGLAWAGANGLMNENDLAARSANST